MSVRRPALLVTLVIALAAPLHLPVAVAQEPTGDYLQVVDLTFPTRPDAGLSDTYDACRDGCDRVHKAADLMGEKMWPLYATVDGEVCRINDDEQEASYGRHLTLCGDDDRQYRYLHLNNDTPGTDDGAAALEHVYAPGIRQGLRVARGQLLAYMGDSGNAEGTAPHLHLDIFDDRVTDPYGDTRINPYPSLVAALARGDVADGSVVASDPVRRVAGDDRVATAIELSRRLPVTSDTVVVARGDDPTDALVAGPLAAALEAPVLITPPHELDPRVLDEVRRREAGRAIVVGTAPTNDVVDALEGAGLTVERLAGSDRFGTADVVAEAVWDVLGADGGIEVPRGQGHVEGDAVPADAEAALVVHGERDRDDTVALDGATVAGDVAIELLAQEPWRIDEVTFLVDGEEVGHERQAPYDLLGSAGGDHPELLDTRTLPNGEHTVVARVDRGGDDDLEVTATVTVANGTARSALLALGDHPDPTRQWPDAMMGSYLGAATQQPVLLTAPDGLSSGTAALLEGLEVTVIGGPVAIPNDVIAGLDARRLAGDDRYGTSVVVTEALRTVDRVGVERVWAATGTNWPDAITAGPVVAALGDALVLVDGDGLGYGGLTSSWLHRFADTTTEGRIIGGPAAVVKGAATAFGIDLT